MTADEVWCAAKMAGLEVKALTVLTCIADQAGLLDHALVSEREIAELTGYSRSLVWDRLQKLIRAGWLIPERRGPARTRWTLRIPAGAG